MIKKTKLLPKSVKQYEKLSGFKTTGDVTLYFMDKKTYGLIEQLIKPK